jgi:hypothetical protein
MRREAAFAAKQAGISIWDRFRPFPGDGLAAFHFWPKTVLAARMARIFIFARRSGATRGSIMTKHDAVIIGTGQAGPSLAGRLAAAGMEVAIIERKLFGGTCVNTGCIPTKTLVASACAAHLARRAAEYGVWPERRLCPNQLALVPRHALEPDCVCVFVILHGQTPQLLRTTIMRSPEGPEITSAFEQLAT